MQLWSSTKNRTIAPSIISAAIFQEILMPTTVLILGARGRFGWAAARAFADAGWRVLGHMRQGAQPPTSSETDRRVEWLRIDLKDTAALCQAARGAQVVVHALNPIYINRAWASQALPMLDAAIAVARQLDATLMFPGNVYNFGDGMPTLLREDTPQFPTTVKGQIRCAMEQRLAQSGVRGIVIRSGDFFGSGRGSWFDQAMVSRLQQGVLTYPGQADVPTAWAYLPDLARTFLAVAERRALLDKFDVLHFAGYSLTRLQWQQVLQDIAQEHRWVRNGNELRVKGMPWPIIRLGAWFNPVWAALLEMRYLWDTPHALDNTRLTTLIGPEPHTPLALAAQSALVDLGQLSPSLKPGPHQRFPDASRPLA
jgi:nucleoside-diphosphate-sugar epimerase